MRGEGAVPCCWSYPLLCRSASLPRSYPPPLQSMMLIISVSAHTAHTQGTGKRRLLVDTLQESQSLNTTIKLMLIVTARVELQGGKGKETDRDGNGPYLQLPQRARHPFPTPHHFVTSCKRVTARYQPHRLISHYKRNTQPFSYPHSIEIEKNGITWSLRWWNRTLQPCNPREPVAEIQAPPHVHHSC